MDSRVPSTPLFCVCLVYIRVRPRFNLGRFLDVVRKLALILPYRRHTFSDLEHSPSVYKTAEMHTLGMQIRVSLNLHR